MRYSVFCVAVLSLGLASCNNRSLPWPSSVPVHNSPATKFLTAERPVTPQLGENLSQPSFLDDGALVGMAISGGGMRANAFTLGVLAEIEEQHAKTARGNAFDTIDFISSNSGGSWAVAVLLEHRTRHAGKALVDRKADIAPLFDSFNHGKVKCFESSLKNKVLGKLKFSDVYPAGQAPKAPFAYFNASLVPSQTGFVFTEAQVESYAIQSFHAACEDDIGHEVTGGIADLPVGFAAATSGSVPTFAYSYAETAICREVAAGASFCGDPQDEKAAKRRLSYLQLVDGGLYDNLGYKTAFELAFQFRDRPASHRGLIFVNSSTDLRYHSIKRSKRHSSHSMAILTSGSFATQDATYARLKTKMFESSGIPAGHQVTLDFNAAGDVDPAKLAGYLDGLPHLADYAARAVDCFDDRGELRKAPGKARVPDGGLPSVADSMDVLRGRGKDCTANNFARVGYLYKTTYAYDPYFFDSAFELGRFVVRKNWDAVAAALGTASR